MKEKPKPKPKPQGICPLCKGDRVIRRGGKSKPCPKCTNR